MKHLAVALIVVALIAADVLSDALGFTTQQAKGWDTACTFGLIGAAAWFWLHRDRPTQ